MNTTNGCIRVYADLVQIRRCTQQIEHFETSIDRFSQVYDLVGSPTRLKILFLLSEENELCVCDLSDILAMTIPAVSQQLRKLKEASMIQARKVGQTVFYSVQADFTAVLDPLLKPLTSPFPAPIIHSTR